ncbi:MAG: ABC transporter ATP-binding protein [Lachnospiraceae bacterium]|nr:ABC transporter ATP-binding protein [Lachnospiraceae bacterium]
MERKTVLSVEHMSKRVESTSYKNGKKTTTSFQLQDIDFMVEPGYIIGLIGCNGAGKTTLLQTILGVYRPDEGRILVNGYDRITESVQSKKKIAYVTDDALFPLGMSAKDMGKAFGPYYENFDYEKFTGLCNRFQIPMKKVFRKLSKGMKIKLQLAFALSYDATLYIFDEPSAGLDPVFRKELMDFFFEIIADGNKSIILSTHLTEELDRIADYILYMEDGTKRFFMEKEELIQKYRIIRGTKNQVMYYRKRIVGMKETETGCEAMVENTEDDYPVSVLRVTPTIEDIMYYFMEAKKKAGKGGK